MVLSKEKFVNDYPAPEDTPVVLPSNAAVLIGVTLLYQYDFGIGGIILRPDAEEFAVGQNGPVRIVYGTKTETESRLSPASEQGFSPSGHLLNPIPANWGWCEVIKAAYSPNHAANSWADATEQLGVEPGQATLLESNPTAAAAALRAGIGRIILVGSWVQLLRVQNAAKGPGGEKRIKFDVRMNTHIDELKTAGKWEVVSSLHKIERQ